MYRVLHQPEIRQKIAGASSDAWLCLAYDGPRGLRELMFSIAKGECQRHEHLEKFQTAVLMLNNPPSLSIQKLRLRSIVALWQESESARRGQEARRLCESSHRPTFGADFGRMDIGLNPGWGRD